jgi:hypothetical protein
VAAAAAAAAAAALAAQAAPKPPVARAVAAAVKTILAALDALFRRRRVEMIEYVESFVREQMPEAPESRVKQLVENERRMELEFQRKARLRLEAELPRAFREPDPVKRAERVTTILEREKRYLRQREQAAAQRAVAALEADLLEQASPEGAYWKLSPLVANHCLKCLAVGNQFWPWEVLRQPWMHIPQHGNCACRLESLADAVRQGLMTEDQLPDTADAITRAKELMDEASRLEEQFAPEELDEAMAELEVLRLEEARKGKALRWSKGLAKGGEFRSKRGGDRGKLSKTELAKLASPSPAMAKKVNHGRTVKIRGNEVFIGSGEHLHVLIGEDRFTSPVGGTNLYRNGKLVSDTDPDLGGPTFAAEDKLFGPGGDPWGPGEFASAKGAPKSFKPPPDPLADKPLVPAGEGAASSTAIPDYTGEALTWGKRAGGSTGARWAFSADGDRWLVKTYNGNTDRVATELLANAIYRELGAPAAEAGQLRFIDPEHGETTALSYPTLDGETRRIEEPSRQLGEHFMADALVANWDFIGLTDDNVLWTPDGDPVRIDQGGTLAFRAQGQPKPFGPIPTEVWTMLSPKGQGFGKVVVTESMKREQARAIADTLTDERIDGLVDAAPFGDEEMREQVRVALKARVGWMRTFAETGEGIPAPLDGAKARKELARAQESLELFPEDYAALDHFAVDGPTVNQLLRDKVPKDQVPPEVRDTVSALDALLRDARLEDDVYGYVPVNPKSLSGDDDPSKLLGRTVSDAGFATASTRRGDMSNMPGFIRLQIPAGSRALYPAGVEGGEDFPGSMPDLILGRGSRMKIVGVEVSDDRVVYDAVVI